MPKFDPSGHVATNIDRVPGRWLVKIPREVTLGEKVRAGIETIDHRNGQPRTSTSGHEMWDAAAVVIDNGPDAPNGAFILGINLIWGGKGRDATYALLSRIGHPVDQWKRETDPAKIPDITPEFFYDKPFVLDTIVNERGYLEPNGFCPYFSATARRGPTGGTGVTPAPRRNGKGAPPGSPSNGDVAPSADAPCGKCKQPASAHPTSACAEWSELPF